MRSALILSALFIGLLALHQGAAAEAGTPDKDPPAPSMGAYTVVNANSSVCLMAQMGLQLNVTYAGVNQTLVALVNLEPNTTSPSGSCEPDTASLTLSNAAQKMNLTFRFTLNTTSNKYHLSGLSLSAVLPDMKEGPPLALGNSSLDLLPAALGHSYMCRDQQTLAVVDGFSLNTFRLHLQAFGFAGAFGAAEECQQDMDDMLIPIIVGAALASLVLVVLVAYLIGRRRSHAGYQTI